MWKILQHKKPDDFVIGSGESHAVKEFVECAFSYVGLNFEEYVKIDPKILGQLKCVN
jgi:GDPmannose 4,6-dehydratase